MALHPPHEKEQLKAIERKLATAPDIQDDLRNYISRITEPYDKVGLDDNIFEFAELVGYRINNSCLDIAEDLDVKSLYGLTTDDVARVSVGSAFRGHHNEEFMADYQFEGLFSEEMNDYIQEIRHEKGGLIGGRATIETHGEQMRTGGLIGGRKIADMINPETGVGYLVEAGLIGGQISKDLGVGVHAQTPEELSKNGLIGSLASAEAQGFHEWSLEEKLDIHKFREESIGKGRYKTSPCWNDTTSKMNEKYGENWSTKKVKDAYHRNKDLLSDEEE